MKLRTYLLLPYLALIILLGVGVWFIEEGRCKVLISFTSAPPEIFRKWRRNEGAA